MTTDEIKKIAEEFASLKNPNPGYHGEESAEFKMARLLEQYTHFLLMKHFIVEKSKVREEYKYSKDSYNRFIGDSDYYEGYWEGRVDSCEEIFGTDAFKETN